MPLFINGQELNKSNSERDLGVIFSNNLKWKDQTLTCVGKSNQMLGIIRKRFTRLDTRLLKTLYVTFVRPLLEFAVPVWSPYQKSDIDLLEEIPSLRKTTYENRLKTLV